MHYIYLITNLINNKIYVGQTNNPSLRWSQHRSNAKYNRGKQVITRAITKYGDNNFTFEVIASCKEQEGADKTEEEIINQYDSRNPSKGYNIDAGGNTTPRTVEVLKKISDALKKHYHENESHMKGKRLSDEWKESLSKAAIGKIGTNTGKKFNNEWKDNISKSLSGRILSEDHKDKLSKSHIGKIAVNRKITFEIAEQIRAEYSAGDITQKQLGKKYNLSQDCIFKIIKMISYTK